MAPTSSLSPAVAALFARRVVVPALAPPKRLPARQAAIPAADGPPGRLLRRGSVLDLLA